MIPTDLRALSRERLGRDGGRRTGPQRGHRRALDHRELLPGLGVGEQDLAADDRQSLGAVPGKRGHPLEQGEAVAERGHRPEVAVRRAVEIDLRRHRPFAAAVALEGLAGPLDRARGVDRSEDRLAGDDRDLGHARILRAMSLGASAGLNW